MQPNAAEENLTRNLGVTASVQQFQISHRTFGPYAQGTYNLGNLWTSVDGLNLTVGARYSVSDEFGSAAVTPYVYGTSFPVPGQGAGLHYSRVKSEAPTYTVGLDYKVPTTLIYGKISRGYKTGGISAAAVNPAYFTYKPEFVFNYEVGSKSDFTVGDVPVRVDSALYYTDYTDMQRDAGNSYKLAFGSTVYNAGKAEIMGFETDVTTQPLPSLTLSANYSYTYAKYKQFSVLYGNALNIPATDCDNKTVTNNMAMNLVCVPFAYAPRHQGSATIRYQLPVPESVGAVDGSVTYSFIDRQYADSVNLPDQSPGAWLGAYGLLNATVGWNRIYGSNFDLRLFGTNLADRTYRISNSNQWTLFFFQSSVYGEPRMFGLSVDYQWGS
jgi:iron complex outermembrane receptor protein